MKPHIDYARIFRAMARMEDTDKARQLLQVVAASAKEKDMGHLTNKTHAEHFKKRKDDIDHLHREIKSELRMVESEVSRKLRRHFTHADIKSGDLPGHEFHGNQYTKPYQDLSIREKSELAKASGIPELSEFRKHFSHIKNAKNGFDILYKGQLIGETHKGTTRLGGSGWVNTFHHAQELTSQGKTHKNLDDALRSAADQVRQREIKKAYKSATQAKSNSFPIIHGRIALNSDALKSASGFEFLFDPETLAADLADILAGTLPDMLVDAGQDVWEDFLPPPEEAQAFITERQNLMSNVAQETFDSVKAELQDGLDKGESYRELSKRLSSKFDEINEGRAQTVASTEVASAYGYARNEAMKQSGAKYKLWIGSGRPPGTLHGMRPAHAAAHYEGQTVAIDEPFRVGGALLMFPTDSSLGAGPELTINCHCVALPAEGPIQSGDLPGHEFHGNQYEEGYSGSVKLPAGHQHYEVTLHYQYPAHDEREGITITVAARSKSEAINIARRKLEAEGHAGTGVLKGRQTFSAKEMKSPEAEDTHKKKQSFPPQTPGKPF